MNPFFNAMGGNTPLPGPMGLIQQINQFAGGIQGSPQNIVQQKLNSGEMSQQQFNVLMQMAQQIAPMMGGKQNSQ